MRNDDMEGCAEAARNAIDAARVCGTMGAEADASVTLGAAMAYLGTVDAGLVMLRFALRLALETAETEVTVGVAAVCVLAIRTGDAFAASHSAGAVRGGLLQGIADGAAALRAHPAAVRLVGADIMCSLIYGTQTVLLVLVARSAGLGLHGYGYLFAGIGAGGVLGTALAGRAVRLPHRTALVAALALVGLPTLALPAAHWGPAAILLAGLTGTGAIGVEIMTETGLQRMLPEEVFGRAYGLALPASIAGIVAGSLIAPVLVSWLGATGALLACGAAVVGYAALLLRGTDAPVPAPATDTVLVG
jgi:hypothetical protein